MTNIDLSPEELDFLKKFELYKQDNGILFYEPIPKAVDFHKSRAPYRLLHGGNRSSKSYSGAAEVVYYALGNHPYKTVETPNEGWVCSKDYSVQSEGIQPIIMKLLPKANIKKITKVKSEVIDTIWVIPFGQDDSTPLEECSKITFKSYDSGVDKFGAAAKRYIQFDEEPPHEIYKESIARIGANMDLDVWLTMTPIWEDKGRKVGMTWTYRELYKKADGKRIYALGVGIEDNIYLSKEQIAEQKLKYHGKEYDIRIKGEFHLLSGNQVFDVEALEDHMKNAQDPKWIGRLIINTRGKIEFVDDPRGYLKVWRKPKDGQYAVGADSGLGVGGDPSAASVRSMMELEQCAIVQGQIPPDEFGEILIKLGHWYNKAWLGIEANSFGIATIDSIKKRYSKMFYRYKVDQRNNRKTKQIGWWTDTKTKPIMIADYGKAIRDGSLEFMSGDLMDEILTYVIKDDGSSNAELGCHDDILISDMICLQTRKYHYRSLAKHSVEEYVPANRKTGY